MRHFWKLMATGFGSGFSPIAPGTAGALMAILLLLPNMFYDFEWLNFGNQWLNEIPFILTILLFHFIGVKSANEMEKEWGHDAQRIVIDEMVGVWIALLFMPINWLTLLLAFVLFRFFVITKPLGIRKMERFDGGWGVMMDDVLAGVYAWVVLKILTLIWPSILVAVW